MSKQREPSFYGMDVFIIVLIMIGFAVIGVLVGIEAGKRSGEIEVLTTHRTHFRLITNPDSTREWINLSDQ